MLKLGRVIFLKHPNVDISQFETIRSKFRSLNPERDFFRKKADLLTWEQMAFYSLPTNNPHKKRLSHDNTTIESISPTKAKKPIGTNIESSKN